MQEVHQVIPQYQTVKVPSQSNIGANQTINIVIPAGTYSCDRSFIQFPCQIIFTANGDVNATTLKCMLGELRYADFIEQIIVNWDGYNYENTYFPAIIMKKKWDDYEARQQKQYTNVDNNNPFNKLETGYIPQLSTNITLPALTNGQTSTHNRNIQYSLKHILNCFTKNQQTFNVDQSFVIELRFRGLTLRNAMSAAITTAPNPVVKLSDSDKAYCVLRSLLNTKVVDDIRQKYFQSKYNVSSLTSNFTIPPDSKSDIQVFGFVKYATPGGDDNIDYFIDGGQNGVYTNNLSIDNTQIIQAQNIYDSSQQFKDLNEKTDAQYTTQVVKYNNVLGEGQHTYLIQLSGDLPQNYIMVVGYQYYTGGN